MHFNEVMVTSAARTDRSGVWKPSQPLTHTGLPLELNATSVRQSLSFGAWCSITRIIYVFLQVRLGKEDLVTSTAAMPVSQVEGEGLAARGTLL